MSLAALARDVARRFHHRGCLISPDYADLAADLREIANTDLGQVRDAELSRLQEVASSFGLGEIAADKPFAFSRGIAVIPIHGILVNKMSWGSSYATGYNYITGLYEAAVADRDVRAIVYDVNSPGGMGAGCGEAAAVLARREKPSLAVVDSRAYSAAYWLASAADRIAVTPSGGAGSIGVVAMHVDYSAMLEQDGIKVTFIHAGAEKVDGNPLEPLSERARETIQRDVDSLYGMFTAGVAANRSLAEDDVRATEARCYLPDEAQELGLIDDVASPPQALQQFLAQPGSSGEAQMTDENRQAEIRSAVDAALRADRERAAGIRTCAEAEGRQPLAEHLALNTSLTVEEARAILGASHKAPPAARNRFTDAMETTGNPNVGGDNQNNGGGGDVGGESPAEKANRILAAFSRATGEKIKTIEHQAAA